MTEITLPQLHCLRCTHTWTPRTTKRPVRCPKCGSPYWDRPRTQRKERTMQHQVPADVRAASVVDETYGAYRAPDGRLWGYTDDPRGEGVSWRDGAGQPVSVAVWLDDADVPRTRPKEATE